MKARTVVALGALSCIAALSPGVAQADEGTFSPSTWEVAFPFTPVGETSAVRRVTITNSGTAAMTYYRLQRGGSHPDDFLVLADGCTGRTVTPNASCFVDLAFRPTAGGTRMGDLRFDHSGEHCSGWLHLAGGGTSGGATARAASHCPKPAGSSSSGQSTITAGSDSTSPIQIPASRTCRSRRFFQVRLRNPRGATITRVEAVIRGKRRLKVLSGKQIKVTVDLRGLPRGRFTLDIRLRTSAGKQMTRTRRFVTCVQDKTA